MAAIDMHFTIRTQRVSRNSLHHAWAHRGLQAIIGVALFATLPPRTAPAGPRWRTGIRNDLTWVRSWGYQLQNADPTQLAASPYDLLVIDYSRDGSDEQAYTREEIRRVQAAGKIVLAYLSIGEAEDYRFYWKDNWDAHPPSFLGPENPEWPGNYKVRFWTGAWWKTALKPYLDRILAAGFDGVYLDLIDAYYYWGEHGYSERKTAVQMIRLVRKIAGYARKRAGRGFIVCPQNGLSVLDDTGERWAQRYLQIIDAVGLEDLFFNVWSPEDKQYRLDLAARVDAAGIPLLNVEYIPSSEYADYQQAIDESGLHIVPYAADPDRELDELLIHGNRPEIHDKIDLWTYGTLLRGANIYQRRVYPELDGDEFLGPGPFGPPYTQADFDRLAELGANLVVISHPGTYSETPPFTPDAAALENLERLVNMASAADLFVVIALRTGPGRSEFTFLLEGLGDWFGQEYLNDHVWTDANAQDAWVEMWRDLAARFRDNPAVVGYDLMVEPNSNEVGGDAAQAPLDIWDPTEFYTQYGGTLYDWNQLYPRIVAAVREVDPDTPILIQPMAYASIDWLEYVQIPDADNIIWSIHQYAPFAYTHQEQRKWRYPGEYDLDEDGASDSFDRDWIDGLLAPARTFAAAHDAPVAVTEFGVMRWARGAPAFLDDQMTAFDNAGFNHAVWLWECSWLPYVREENAFNYRFGPARGKKREVRDNPLLQALRQHWRRNWVRPSNVTFESR